jgi:hypothetical protein
MDEEDGTSLSNTADMPVTPPNNTPLIPEAFTAAISNAHSEPKVESAPIAEAPQPRTGIEVDEDGDGILSIEEFNANVVLTEERSIRTGDKNLVLISSKGWERIGQVVLIAE